MTRNALKRLEALEASQPGADSVTHIIRWFRVPSPEGPRLNGKAYVDIIGGASHEIDRPDLVGWLGEAPALSEEELAGPSGIVVKIDPGC